MTKYIDAEPLYNQIVEKEELARQRVIDTPSRFPNGNINPYATRYATQLDERTTFKFMLTDAPAANVEPVQRWIPVTDRFPEKYGQYLVTFILQLMFYGSPIVYQLSQFGSENIIVKLIGLNPITIF